MAECPEGQICAVAADKTRHIFPLGTPKETIDAAMKNYANRELSIGEVPGQALSNLGPSAERLIESAAQPFMHPIATAEGIERTVTGGLAKVVPGASAAAKENIPYADAFGQMVKDRYGGWKNFKHTLATDPAGAAADLLAVLDVGGGLAARAPGVIGKVGETAQAVGRLEPVTKAAGKTAAAVGGMMTGKGRRTLEAAAGAGYEGGARGEAFRANIAGREPITGIVESARAAKEQLRQERGRLYRSGMVDVSNDKTILDFNDIDQAISDAMRVKTFKGQELSESTKAVRDKMTAEINKWKMLDPAEYRTPEGIDALKQKLGDILDSIPFDQKPSRLAAGEIYNAVRGTIVKQVPAYAKVMEGYETATDEIRMIEQELSLNPRASVDTSLRKITAALRDGVNTNYGRRAELVDFLAQNGATHLLEKIAGVSLKELMPEGLQRLAGGAEGAGALYAAASGNPLIAAKIAALMASHSPRLWGELAFGTGVAARYGSKLRLPEVGLGSVQVGRALGSTNALSPQTNQALEGPEIPDSAPFQPTGTLGIRG